MANEFAINIAVNPGGAPTAIANVHKPLAELEAMGPRVSDSLTKSMTTGASSADRLRESSRGAADGVRELAEGGVKLEGSFSQSLLGRFGELGNVLGELASKGTIAAAGLVALGVEVIHLSDEYTTLQNSTLRLADSFEKVDETMRQQLTLSKQLHGSLEQTTELSILMKEKTEDLGYSTVDQARLTKEWGIAVQLSGHALADAGPALRSFATALAEGQTGAKQLKMIIGDYPEIAKELERHFGVDTPAALYKLAQEGKMHASDLYQALDEGADSSAERFQKMGETFSQQMGHVKDELSMTFGKLAADSGIVDSLANSFKGLASLIEASTVPLQKLDGLLGGNGNIKQFITSGFLGNLNHLMGGDEKEGQFSIGDITKDFTDKAGAIAIKAWSDSFHIAIGSAEHDTRSMADTFALSLTPKVEHHTKVLSDQEKLLKEINGPMEKMLDTEALLDKIYNYKQVSVGKYTAAMEKLREEVDKLNEAETKLALHALDRTFGDFASTYATTEAKHLGHALAGAGAATTSAAEAIGSAADAASIERAKAALADYNKEVEDTKRILEAGFRPLGNELIKLAETGKFSFSSMADSIIGDLLRMEVKWLELKAIGFLTSAINGPAPGSNEDFLSTATSIAAHVDGGANGMERTIVHAASGYSGTFGGQGGTDSQLFMARVTPGEHVSIQTPQQRAAAQQQAPVQHTQIINKIDPRDLTEFMSGPEGGRVIVNHIRLNASALRGILGR